MNSQWRTFGDVASSSRSGGNTTLKAAGVGKRGSKKRVNSVGVPGREKHLVTALIAAIRRKAAPRKSVVVTREMDCFQGVADVVTGTYNGYRLFPHNARTNLHLLSFSTAKVLSCLVGRRTANIKTIADASGLAISTIKKELAVLRKMEMLRARTGSLVSIAHGIRQPFKEIAAFEVKVKDWKSGIYQARNYRSFAHKVSVALPLNRARLLRKRLNDFRRMRVGLLGIGPAGDLEWFLKPRRQRPISNPRSFLAAINLLRAANR